MKHITWRKKVALLAIACSIATPVLGGVPIPGHMSSPKEHRAALKVAEDQAILQTALFSADRVVIRRVLTIESHPGGVMLTFIEDNERKQRLIPAAFSVRIIRDPAGTFGAVITTKEKSYIATPN